MDCKEIQPVHSEGDQSWVHGILHARIPEWPGPPCLPWCPGLYPTHPGMALAHLSRVRIASALVLCLQETLGTLKLLLVAEPGPGMGPSHGAQQRLCLSQITCTPSLLFPVWALQPGVDGGLSPGTPAASHRPQTKTEAAHRVHHRIPLSHRGSEGSGRGHSSCPGGRGCPGTREGTTLC